ncbi:MAG: sigma-70 family RNA polymerase sigma factor [Pyrinomonadaceae bacterium]
MTVKNLSITEKDFEQLLSWLHQDREEAARQYEKIRHSLIKIFTWRGYSDAEDLADETINRVTRKISTVAPKYVGNAMQYFYAVANNLMLETDRRKRLQLPLRGLEPEPTYMPLEDKLIEEDIVERELKALEECLKKLRVQDRELITEYYSRERKTKLSVRKKLAQKYDLRSNALRVRVHRIRAVLEKCIRNKIEGEKL